MDKKEKIQINNKNLEKNISEEQSPDDEFKQAKSSEERIKILMKKLKKLQEVQAYYGSKNFKNSLWKEKNSSSREF
ncbi:hypothetical protein [Halanaerobium hydrogeniformans]|uniref:Uncharacterized protein n=1 Tax=Halanaerobium hydrogeniformans TaxID=656519 RepID=E4RND0_HALHG|nr:hypothetical protein [Halanaerobium hydrogeniformans]ADQ13598.1 hypothetical protein Halsa_0107 [Halanaerobium hydrogeniformans]